MRCCVCHSFSKDIVCESCKSKLLVPHVHKRKSGSTEVVSLFGYKSIEELLLSKHKPDGFRIYKYLSKNFIEPFVAEFMSGIQSEIYLMGIDERVANGYSHTALLSHYGTRDRSKVLHSKLMAKNDIKYAGKSLQFRIDNPRDFVYTGPQGIDVILIDDIVTTGSTISEATNVLKSYKVNVIFALTLADAQY